MEAFGLLILLSFGAVCAAVILLVIAAGCKSFGKVIDDVEDHRRWIVWLSILATTISLTTLIWLTLALFMSASWAMSHGQALAIGSFLLAAVGVLLAWRASGPGRVSSGIAAVWMVLVWTPVMIVILSARLRG